VKRCALAMLLLWSCRKAPADERWFGIPMGAISCTHGYSLDELRCVVDGHAFLCVRDWEREIVSCAPVAVLP
jgi:hypothetical protein